jgi:ligand-binding SRPBCC domain-containing protein
MLYQQKVILKDIDVSIVIQSFHDRRFVEFLTSFQPVQINSWEGINNGKEASFSFWFFGWREIKVSHDNYGVTDTHLHFEDIGLVLPFGLSKWHHHHIVRSYNNGAMIIDKVNMDSNGSLIRYLAYPIMLFPIFVRRITYKIWFYWLNNNFKN